MFLSKVPLAGLGDPALALSLVFRLPEQRDLGPFALGDVRSGAAIACERADVVVHRLAADRIVGVLSVRLDGRKFEVMKRPPRVEVRFVLSPVRIGQEDIRQVPMRQAEDVGAPKRAACDELGKPKVPILLPVPIGGQKVQCAEPTLAAP